MRRHTRRLFAYQGLANLFFDRAIFTIFLLQSGVSIGVVGLLQSVLWIGSALGEVPLGHVGDRIGHKNIVIAGRLLTIGYFLLMAFGGSPIAYFIGFAAFGIGQACISGSDVALLYETARGEEGDSFDFTKDSGRFDAIAAVALAAAMGLGGYLQLISWTAVYLACAAAHLIAILMLAAVADPRESHGEEDSPTTFAETFAFAKMHVRDPQMSLFLSGMCLFGSAVMAMSIFIPVILNLGGAAGSIVAIIMMVRKISSGVMASQVWRVKRALGVQRMFIAVPLSIVALTVLVAVVPWQWAAGLLIATSFLDRQLDQVLAQLLNDRLPDNIRAGSLSLYSFAFSVCSIIMFPVAGLFADLAGTAGVVWFLAGIMVVAGLLMARIPSVFMEKTQLQEPR